MEIMINTLTLVDGSCRTPWERVSPDCITCIESFHLDGNLIVRRVWMHPGNFNKLERVRIVLQ